MAQNNASSTFVDAAHPETFFRMGGRTLYSRLREGRRCTKGVNWFEMIAELGIVPVYLRQYLLQSQARFIRWCENSVVGALQAVPLR